MALPAVESLAAAFPPAHIHAFAGRHSAPVFRASKHISWVYLTPDQLTASRVPGMAWNLRTAGHDWVVLLDRSRWLIAAARSAAPARLVTMPRTKSEPRHEIDIYLDTVRSAGVPPVTTIPKLPVSDAAREVARRALKHVDGPYAVLHPGGADNPGTAMHDKRWPAERFAAIADELTQRGIRPVLTGGPADIDVCAQVERLTRSAQPVTLAGKLDLLGTTAVIEGARLYLGNDTGVSHLAAAVGTPSVVVFGPTNPLRYGPRGEHVTILAPDGSRSLPDMDLRKRSSVSLPSTDDVDITDVLLATENLLTSTGPSI